MIAARSVRVIVRATVSGGGSGGGAIADEAVERADQQRPGRAAARRTGRAPASAAAWAAPGSRRNRPTRRNGLVRQASARVAVGAVEQQAGPQLGLGVGRLVASPAGRRGRGWRGSIARLLIRISWLATATNALTLPSRSTSSVASASR